MIDASEPKDGDYVRYVEALVNAPKAQQLQETSAGGWGHGAEAPERGRGGTAGAAAGQPTGQQSTGTTAQRFPRQVAYPDAGATRPDAGHARPDAGTTRPEPGSAHSPGESLEARLQQLQRLQATLAASPGALPQLLRRIAGFASFAGIAMILLSFTDDPPFFAHPVPGILLIAVGAFLRGLPRKLR